MFWTGRTVRPYCAASSLLVPALPNDVAVLARTEVAPQPLPPLAVALAAVFASLYIYEKGTIVVIRSLSTQMSVSKDLIVHLDHASSVELSANLVNEMVIIDTVYYTNYTKS